MIQMALARAVVNHNVTPMRAEARAGAELVSQAIFGETVEALEEDGEFTLIRTPDSYQGWTPRVHLSILETGERYPDPVRAAMVAPLFLPAFREPSAQSARLTLLTLGTVVEAAEGDPESEFRPIRFPAGQTGYVEGSALIVPQYPRLQDPGPNLSVVARGFVGVPYLWGGRTPFGIDCSGFTQRVYWLCGATLPRDAYLQAASDSVEHVGADQIKPGDLLFFEGDDDPRSRGITHVGVALGKGHFIHSARPQGVAITRLDEPPYERLLRCAARFK